MAWKGQRIGVSVAYVRGGTSKAMFFHEHDLPPLGQHRDQLLKRIVGAKSSIHIDGMGGGRIVTSKIAIIKPSDRDDADVDYTFAQIGIGEDTIGYDGNCGNISSGVGPFAIDEGLMKEFRRVAKALDLCISGHESASSINENTALIARCKELRGRAATLIGMCNDPEKVDEQSPFLPMVILVAPPTTRGGHLSARLFLDNSCHTSMAGTGAICLAACSRILGSVVCNQIGHEALNDAMLQICHPMGIMPVSVQTEKALMAPTDEPDFQTLSLIRSSRRIMDGTVYVPAIPQADGS